ncbi:Glutamine--tRNA ligase [Thermosinus carboxydivorans Nor1]|uniref:Glutamine--tRNA ligase n=1 Tax=Thermosinus carboxydivorans Nor1 TaxID=401526 RepID=A1HQV7_9FIRM|nr:Glutamine--tRNA ligase [Thermosinus carboxydivorans Nor1]
MRPLKVVIENYPEGQVEELKRENNPEAPEAGTRKIPFSRVIYIEQDDFMENPPKKFFRLSPGQEVRLKHAYIIKCERVVKDEQTGEIIELRCTYDPETRSGAGASRKVKGTLHWVSAAHAVPAEVRLYDYLLLDDKEEEETEGDDFLAKLNPASLVTLTNCLVEPSLAGAAPGSRYQFLRQGYFCVDPDSANGKLVFNRIVGLRDSWAKLQKE